MLSIFEQFVTAAYTPSHKRNREQGEGGVVQPPLQRRRLTTEADTEATEVSNSENEAESKRHGKEIKSDKFYRYVSKNKKLVEIKEKLLTTNDGEKKLQALLKAIKNQNYKSEIFKDQDCMSVVQTLFELDKLDNEQRTSLFLYLSVLQSHSTWQNLREEDNKHLKHILDVDYISEANSKYQALLDSYLDEVIAKLRWIIEKGTYPQLALFDKATVKQELATFIKVKAEQGFIVINEAHGFRDSTFYAIIDKFFSSHFFLFVVLDRKTRTKGVVPSASILMYLLNKINPEYNFSLSPFLGQVKPITVFSAFSSNRERPVNFYNVHVSSNPKNVHDNIFGAFNIALHDIGHMQLSAKAMTGKLLTFYQEEMVPFFLEVIKVFQDFPEECKQAETFFQELNDFYIPLDSIMKHMYFYKKNPKETSILKEIMLIVFLLSREHNKQHYGFEMNLVEVKQKFMSDHGQDKLDNILSYFSYKKTIINWEAKDIEQLRCSLIHNEPLEPIVHHTRASLPITP